MFARIDPRNPFQRFVRPDSECAGLFLNARLRRVAHARGAKFEAATVAVPFQLSEPRLLSLRRGTTTSRTKRNRGGETRWDGRTHVPRACNKVIERPGCLAFAGRGASRPSADLQSAGATREITFSIFLSPSVRSDDFYNSGSLLGRSIHRNLSLFFFLLFSYHRLNVNF